MNQPRKKKMTLAQQFASRGGKAGRGKSKARTSAQARRAVRARWARSNHMKTI